MRKKRAALLSFVVPTHSKGLNFFFPVSSAKRETRVLSWNRFFLNIPVSCFSDTKGYSASHTNRHLAHLPHHSSFGFFVPDLVLCASLQLKNTEKYFGYRANIFAIWSS